jgi:FkbM family methyltransferase
MFTVPPFDGPVTLMVEKKMNPCQRYIDTLRLDLLFDHGTLIDVGSYFGWLSIPLADKVDMIQCFEPCELSCDLLKKNMRLNKLDNMIVHNVALGREEAKSKLTYSPDRYNAQIDPENGTESITIKPLDAFNIRDVCMIIIDINGGEYDVLIGSLCTIIKSSFPPILINLEHENMMDRKPLVHLLNGLGYDCNPYNSSLYWTLFKHPDYNLTIPIPVETGGYSAETFLVKGKEFLEGKNYKLSAMFTQRAIDTGLTLSRLKEAQTQMSLACYYLDQKDESLKWTERALFSLPKDGKAGALEVLKYLVKPLSVEKIKLEFSGCDIPDGFYPSSSSLLKTDNGYLFNIRCVSYYIEKNGQYTGNVNTKNVLVVLNERLEFVSSSLMVDDTLVSSYHIKGMEDCRLISNNTLFCTRMDLVPTREKQTARMCICTLEENRVTSCVPLNVRDADCEKNWLPFYIEDNLYFVYGFDPLEIYKLVDNKPHLWKVIESSMDLSSLRGSASPIPYKGGYVLVTHQVAEGSPRTYFHRFVFIDENWRIHVSDAWSFENEDIEYTLSISILNDTLIIPYSTWDRTCKMCFVKLSVMDDMLKIV